MNASASILTVGLASMKRPSGWDASSITATAIRIATTITGTYSPAMPTAAITESRENTISMTAIWAITAPNDTAALPLMSAASSWSTLIISRISIPPCTSRNRPPRIRIRSRTEMPCPNSTKRSVVSRASHASVSSSPMRVMQATAMPNLRANSRCSTGSRPTAIEMNTRLSMPSTISIVLKVSNRIHTCGSVTSSIIPENSSVRSKCSCCSAGRLEPARQEDQRPDDADVEHGHEHRRRAHVLGPAHQLVVFIAEAVDHRLQRRIEQFHQRHQQAASKQQRPLHAGFTQPQRQRCEHRQQVDLQAERGFVQPRSAKPLHRPDRRLDDPFRPARQMPELVGHGCAVNLVQTAILPYRRVRPVNGATRLQCAAGAASLGPGPGPET